MSEPELGYTAIVTFSVPAGAEHLQDAEAVEHEVRCWLESLGASVLLLSVIEHVEDTPV